MSAPLLSCSEEVGIDFLITIAAKIATMHKKTPQIDTRRSRVSRWKLELVVTYMKRDAIR